MRFDGRTGLTLLRQPLSEEQLEGGGDEAHQRRLGVQNAFIRTWRVTGNQSGKTAPLLCCHHLTTSMVANANNCLILTDTVL
jgi:hypothetical protein